MRLVLFSILHILILAGCAGTSENRASQSCPASIPAPVLYAGDTWRWQDEKGANWYRRYGVKTTDGLLEREGPANAPRQFYDDAHTLRKVYRDGQWITADSLDFPLLGKPSLDFPLQPGKTWSYVVNARSIDGSLFTYRTTYMVRGCEHVRVPAGTFLAVVVEEEQAVIGRADRGSRTWWYAPEVEYFIKLTHGYASHPGFWGSFRDWALTSYQITPPPAGASTVSPAIPQQPTSSSPTPSSPVMSPQAPAASSLGSPQSTSSLPASVLAPTWQRGYEWQVRWSSPRGSGTFFWTIVREETVAGVAYYVMKTDNRESYYAKADLAWLMDLVDGVVEARSTPAEQRLVWPLAVGKQWETKVQLEWPLQRTTEERRRVVTVEAWEVITVPAGSFGSFHIVVRDPTGRITSESWFAPDVRQMVKDKTYFDLRCAGTGDIGVQAQGVDCPRTLTDG